jgi:hypothetical protein
LLGMFEDALAAVQKGPLPSAALDRLSGLQQTFAGELRWRPWPDAVHGAFAGVHRSQRLRPRDQGAVRAPQALVQAIDERCCGSRVGTARGEGPFREALRPARNGK